MDSREKPDEKQSPKKKRRKGFFARYFSFLALVAGISSAEKPWEEEEDTPEEKDPPRPK